MSSATDTGYIGSNDAGTRGKIQHDRNASVEYDVHEPDFRGTPGTALS